MDDSHVISVTTREYLSKAPKGPLSLVIVGQDPFPTGATGIPFSKETWKEQLAPSSAALYVLNTLGIDADAAKAEFKSCPDELFRALRDQGVVVLNASYTLPDERKSSALSWSAVLDESRTYDRGILERAERTVLCGRIAQRLSKLPYVNNPEHYVHPAVRNKTHPITSVREAWHKQWGNPSLSSLWSCNDGTTNGARLLRCRQKSGLTK